MRHSSQLRVLALRFDECGRPLYDGIRGLLYRHTRTPPSKRHGDTHLGRRLIRIPGSTLSIAPPCKGWCAVKDTYEYLFYAFIFLN